MSRTRLSGMIVADVMARWPLTVEVFHAHGMACPGCVMAPFMTVADAAVSYGLDEADLSGALVAAIRNHRTRARRSGERKRAADEDR